MEKHAEKYSKIIFVAYVTKSDLKTLKCRLKMAKFCDNFVRKIVKN